MINQSHFIKLYLRVAFCLLVLSFTACKKQQEDSKELANEKNEAKFEDNKEEDAKFLADAAEFDLQQAELGKLTALKSENAEVKAFGKMMEEMYNEKVSSLNAFASSKQMSVPTSITENNKEDYNTLNKKDIDDFDKFYLGNVVDKHTDAIDRYTEKAKQTHDPELKQWLNVELASLREHLDGAITLQSKLKLK